MVRAETDSEQALAAAEEFQPDLILLDVMMPGLDGGQLATRFEADPKLNKVPIVFLTAAATKSEIYARGGKVGGLPFLAKPVEISAVVACIKQQLGQEERRSEPPVATTQNSNPARCGKAMVPSD